MRSTKPLILAAVIVSLVTPARKGSVSLARQNSKICSLIDMPAAMKDSVVALTMCRAVQSTAPLSVPARLWISRHAQWQDDGRSGTVVGRRQCEEAAPPTPDRPDPAAPRRGTYWDVAAGPFQNVSRRIVVELHGLRSTASRFVAA